jgi:hypothetical protein
MSAAPVKYKQTLSTPFPVWFGALVVLGLWMLARPYNGLRHDGIFYIGQVMLHMWPDIFKNDLFFKYGSQDQFSIFASLLERLYHLLGVPVTQVLVLVVCGLSFMISLAWALRWIESPLERWAGLATVAVFSHLYSANGTFAFTEGFVTARSLAEPLALAGIVLVLRGRLVTAGATLLLSAAAHPLMALPAVTVVWAYLSLSNRRWLWSLALLPLPAVLGVLGIKPFDALFVRFDTAWWESVSVANVHVFMLNWIVSDWQILVIDAGVLWLAMHSLGPPLAQLARALLLASTGLLALTAIGADLLHDALLTQLQLFRVLWLTHLFALAFLPAMLWRRWNAFNGSRLPALSLAAAMLAANSRWPAGWALIAWAFLVEALVRSGRPVTPRLDRIASMATALVMVVLTVAIPSKTLIDFREGGAPMNLPNYSLALMTVPTISMALAAALYLGWTAGKRSRGAAVAGALVLAGYGAIHWDRRDDWNRYVEDSIFREHPFEKFIPRHAEVLWNDNQLTSWMLLKRANFVSSVQGAGFLFNRGTAIEFQRRAPAIGILQMQKEICAVMQGVSNSPEQVGCAPAPEVLSEICRIPHGPDFIVLSDKVPKGEVAEWTFNSPTRKQTFYLYDCSKLR